MKYDQEVAEKIFEGLRSGKTLSATLRENPTLPKIHVIFKWLEVVPGFRDSYDAARKIGYEIMADQVIDIADNFHEQVITITKPDGGTETISKDHFDHRKLQVDVRKWMLSKSLPKFASSHKDSELTITVKNDIED